MKVSVNKPGDRGKEVPEVNKVIIETGGVVFRISEDIEGGLVINKEDGSIFIVPHVSNEIRLK